jgi:hypothetical protein
VFLAGVSAVEPKKRDHSTIVPGTGPDAADSPSASMALADVERLLGTPLSADELCNLRRQFALARHPDRVPTSERDTAGREMARVNMLIDAALARCDPPGTDKRGKHQAS